MCTGNVYMEDAEKTGWTSDRQPVCSDCMGKNGWDKYSIH